jgi:hypothetical protein
MRRLVLVDRSGAILATVPHPEDMGPQEPGAPVFVGIEPLEGQTVHTVTVPEDLQSAEGLLKLHESYTVQETAQGPRLSQR